MHSLLDLALANDLDHARSAVVLTHRWGGLRHVVHRRVGADA